MQIAGSGGGQARRSIFAFHIEEDVWMYVIDELNKMVIVAMVAELQESYRQVG